MRNAPLRAASVLAILLLAGPARAADDKAFDQHVKPFLKRYCVRCHNADKPTSGVRVDHLDASLEDKHLKLWGEVAKQLRDGTMPPEDATQPTAEERKRAAEWVAQALAAAAAERQP